MNEDRPQCRLCGRTIWGSRREVYGTAEWQSMEEDASQLPSACENCKKTVALERQCARYGITVADYWRMFGYQQGGCAICGKKPKVGERLRIDHCHQTEKVRGLLCGGCNSALGMLGDNAAGLRRALSYLEEFELSSTTASGVRS